MADHAPVLSVVEDRVAILTINRPDKRNALDTASRRALVEALNALRHDDAVRCIVITGAGEKAFVAGADITEFENRSPIDQFRSMNALAVYETVERIPKPTIAAINGYCLGGGCELAMACDIRIASERAKLGQPEIGIGIIPGGGATQRLPRLVGMGRALKLMYTGETIDAAEALRIGLVDEVVAPEHLLERVRELAAAIARKSPVALRLIKEGVQASARMPLDEGLRYERTLFGIAFSSDDKAEGIRAFLEKRPPEFRGR